MIDFKGNVVVIGDVHIGAEIFAEGNIVILGQLKGRAFAGTIRQRKRICRCHQAYTISAVHCRYLWKTG